VYLFGHSHCHESLVLEFSLHSGGCTVLGLDYFVHAHILSEEPDYFVSMLYGHKAIWLHNPALRLYSCESLTLHVNQNREARLHRRIPWNRSMDRVDEDRLTGLRVSLNMSRSTSDGWPGSDLTNGYRII
jgi:hypothetical protein